MSEKIDSKVQAEEIGVGQYPEYLIGVMKALESEYPEMRREECWTLATPHATPQELVDLYFSIHHEHKRFWQPVYDHILEILKKDGYRVERGWGVYLHCPDGNTVILDWWNEQEAE